MSSPLGTLHGTLCLGRGPGKGRYRERTRLRPPGVEATAPGGRAPAVLSQSPAPGVAVAPRSARAPPPPWSRSQSRRPSPALEAAGPGQTDFLLLWRTASCGAAGCGLLATGELAGVAGTSLPPRVPTTLPRTGGNSGRPGAERRAGAREMRSRRGGAIGATAPVPGR